jgi:hypothetical protein
MSETPQLQDSPEQPPSESGDRPHFSRSLSSANFSPNGDLYDSLDDDWLLSTETGELTLFDFLDSFSVVPQTLDKLNQRFKLQSQGVPYFISGWRDADVCVCSFENGYGRDGRERNLIRVSTSLDGV